MKKNRKTKSKSIYRNFEKLNINPYTMKRRPVKRTAFHRIGTRRQ